MVNVPPQSFLFRLPRAYYSASLGKLNEKALNLIFEGNLEEGQAMLVASLVVGLHRLSTIKDDTSMAILETTNNCANQACSLFDMSLEQVVSENTPADDPSWFQFYRYTFGTPQDDNDDHDMPLSTTTPASNSRNDPHLARTHVALCAYNLAVVQHEIGLQYGDLKRLAEARTFYQTALAHLQTMAKSNEAVALTDASLVWLTLAAQNNLGHIYSFLGDCVGVMQCRQALQDHLALLPPTSWGWFRTSLARANQLWTHQAPAA